MALNRVLKMGIMKTQNDLSKSLGISQGRISKLLSILKLSDDVLYQVTKTSYKDVTVLAAINKIDKDKQYQLFESIKILPREEALKKIKAFTNKKQISVKRIVHSNNNIKINTKGVSKETKEQVLSYIHQIELLLNKEENYE
jgi:hypothetical protein